MLPSMAVRVLVPLARLVVMLVVRAVTMLVVRAVAILVLVAGGRYRRVCPWWRGWPPRECSACWIASVTSWDACSLFSR